jgi:DNA modification methylase
MVKEQLITEDYAIYNTDCMYLLSTLENESIDLSIYSPPFAGLYNYSSSSNDFSNCDSKEQFLEQFEFLIKEISRLTKPGRITCVHVQNIKDPKTGNMWDFPHEVVKLHNKHGFDWKDKITIWKEPLKVRLRTMVQSLMHKFIVEDSTKCFTAMPDYLLVFKKKGENLVPVTHKDGLKRYAGAVPMLPEMIEKYGKWEDIQEKYRNFKGKQIENKYSQIIWQRYASSVWDDIRIDNVLEFKESRDEDDEKHVHPLQLDVIDRCVELWSNSGEIVLTPFMGVGSEVYSPVSMNRKAIGIELKESYYKQSVKNLKDVHNRFNNKQKTIHDAIRENNK